ncbi:MAG: hypothetical protein ACLFVW_00070 [Phycisphaerae bacterium]
MSGQTHTPLLREMGESHYGRKTVQPTRSKLRSFYKHAEQRLAYPTLWFNSAERQATAEAIDEVMKERRLTCYACAILSDHVHLLIRKHRLKGEQMREEIKQQTRRTLQTKRLVPPNHPVFSADVCDWYKSTPGEIRSCISYIEDNFRKHRIPFVRYPFVVPYDGWPFAGGSRTTRHNV